MRLVGKMSKVEIPFDETEQKMSEELYKHERGYLATSEGESVYVRQMMVLSDGLKIWLLTDKRSRKYQHIKANPNVGLAVGLALHLEDVASLKGHPLEEENKRVIKAFQKKLHDIYERSLRPGRILKRPGTRVIEITPKRIALNVWVPHFDLEGFQPYTDILNVEEGKAYRRSMGTGTNRVQ